VGPGGAVPADAVLPVGQITQPHPLHAAPRAGCRAARPHPRGAADAAAPVQRHPDRDDLSLVWDLPHMRKCLGPRVVLTLEEYAQEHGAPAAPDSVDVLVRPPECVPVRQLDWLVLLPCG